MRTVLAALAGASLLAAALPAAADSHHGGGGGGSSRGSAGASQGAWHGGGSGNWRGGSAGARSDWRGGGSGFNHFHGGRDHFRGAPLVFGGFGLGFALGLEAGYPWYYDAPFYGYYPGYAYAVAPRPYAYPPTYDDGAYAPPPPAASGAASPPPAACGSWRWDTVKQVYNWIPC
jgi:hypothetical protein